MRLKPYDVFCVIESDNNGSEAINFLTDAHCIM